VLFLRFGYAFELQDTVIQYNTA